GRVTFVDVDPVTYNLDLEQVEARLTPRTRAIIPVHLYGQPAPMDAVADLARRRDLLVVQDCAQAHGATLHGRPCIEFGGVLCYSFYPGKNLGAYGDGGAIVTNDEELARRCRMTANHGRMSKFDHEFEAVNSRLDGLQGAILSVKLPLLEAWTERRRAIATHYDRLLADLDEVTTPAVADGARHVYHLYVIRTRQRDALRRHLQESGISAGIHYPVALPNLTAYRHLGHRREDFPVASRYQDEILSLPMYPELADEMVARVAEEIRSYFAGERDVS
ncbi:MAG: DegT/DnrJ/EryC1/StrS family aminotransferase, partial [bacterium]|nr:DegT/DnrJ/EryC1/StrS family aminotransferase [bacterium]